MSYVHQLLRVMFEAGKAAVVTRAVAKHLNIHDEEMQRIVANAIWIRMNAGG